MCFLVNSLKPTIHLFTWNLIKRSTPYNPRTYSTIVCSGWNNMTKTQFLKTHYMGSRLFSLHLWLWTVSPLISFHNVRGFFCLNWSILIIKKCWHIFIFLRFDGPESTFPGVMWVTTKMLCLIGSTSKTILTFIE